MKSLCEILLKRAVQLTNVSGISTNALGNLRNIELSGQYLADNEAVILAEFMPSKNAVTSIDLKGNQFTSAAVQPLLRVLQKCPKLDKVSSLPYAEIKSNRLSDLACQNRGLGDFEGFLLADMIRGNKSLTSVNVRGNNFVSPEAALALAEAVRANGNISPFNQYHVKPWHSGEIQKITLCKCDPPLGDFDGTLVAHLFKGSATMRVVDLSENDLTLVGIREVIQVLPSLKALEEVRLQGNVFLDREALASILRDLEPVTASVNVWGIPTSQSERAIALSVFSNSISSSGMHVDLDCVRVMAKVLSCPEVQRAVTRLDFEGIALSPLVVRALFRAIPEHFTLTLWGMEITPQDFPIILPLIEGDKVDIFTIASKIGQKHGRLDSPTRA
jgi:hypothetical protein